MADLPEREKREQELAVLLLLIFASQDLNWWLTTTLSPIWFRRRITRLNIPDFARKISDTSFEEMLREVEAMEYQSNRQLRKMTESIEDRFRDHLADGLYKTYENWKLDWEKKKSRGMDPEQLPEIYPDWKAKRDSRTRVTETVSWTEDRTKYGLEQFFGIKLISQWKLDPFSNWCPSCYAMRDTYDPFWRRYYPSGPPIHANCACHLFHFNWTGEDIPDSRPNRRRGGDLIPPQAVPEPFERRIAFTQPFSSLVDRLKG